MRSWSAAAAIFPVDRLGVGYRGHFAGVGLVEVYDLAQSANSRLANVSTRGCRYWRYVMIGGLIHGPTQDDPTSVWVRAGGPLASFWVSNALLDPTLELHNGNGNLFASNDNWKETQQADIEATGLPPTDGAESAILVTLAPGNYTAIVRGALDTMGIGLVEAYDLG